MEAGEDEANNTLTLKSATAEKSIQLGVRFGLTDVTVGKMTVAADQSMDALAKEIVSFFSDAPQNGPSASAWKDVRLTSGSQSGTG